MRDGKMVGQFFPQRAAALAVLFISICSAIGGCATTAALEPQNLARDAKSARLYFIRPSTIFGVGLSPDIKINGKLIGNVAVASYIYVDRPSGQYQILLDHEFEPDSFSHDVTLRPGEDHYFQIVQGGPPNRVVIIGKNAHVVGAPSRHGPFQIVPVDAQTGQAMINRIKS
jgi:hypothetical protein